MTPVSPASVEAMPMFRAMSVSGPRCGDPGGADDEWHPDRGLVRPHLAVQPVLAPLIAVVGGEDDDGVAEGTAVPYRSVQVADHPVGFDDPPASVDRPAASRWSATPIRTGMTASRMTMTDPDCARSRRTRLPVALLATHSSPDGLGL